MTADILVKCDDEINQLLTSNVQPLEPADVAATDEHMLQQLKMGNFASSSVHSKWFTEKMCSVLKCHEIWLGDLPGQLGLQQLLPVVRTLYAT